MNCRSSEARKTIQRQSNSDGRFPFRNAALWSKPHSHGVTTVKTGSRAAQRTAAERTVCREPAECLFSKGVVMRAMPDDRNLNHVVKEQHYRSPALRAFSTRAAIRSSSASESFDGSPSSVVTPLS